jgi:SAM-dependent methyltransferase
MPPDRLLEAVERYYSGKVVEHGATARGADWKDEASQELRFRQLLEVCTDRGPFSINDYGCGYGALVSYLERNGYSFTYRGFDISEPMLAQARATYGDRSHIEFVGPGATLPTADYTVSSGLFNVKLDTDPSRWGDYVLSTLGELDRLSGRGFAFNMLTAYSDREKMRADLHYADPGEVFDHCKRRFSRHVALLHDYGLYEFTILVRRDPRT